MATTDPLRAWLANEHAGARHDEPYPSGDGDRPEHHVRHADEPVTVGRTRYYERPEPYIGLGDLTHRELVNYGRRIRRSAEHNARRALDGIAEGISRSLVDMHRHWRDEDEARLDAVADELGRRGIDPRETYGDPSSVRRPSFTSRIPSP